jgi:hypothetical protein
LAGPAFSVAKRAISQICLSLVDSMALPFVFKWPLTIAFVDTADLFGIGLLVVLLILGTVGVSVLPGNTKPAGRWPESPQMRRAIGVWLIGFIGLCAVLLLLRFVL